MQINVNQQCTVVLSQRGVDILNKMYGTLRMDPPKVYAAGQSYTGQLWDIMNIFGRHMYMGPPPPFETTIEVDHATD